MQANNILNKNKVTSKESKKSSFIRKKVINRNGGNAQSHSPFADHRMMEQDGVATDRKLN